MFKLGSIRNIYTDPYLERKKALQQDYTCTNTFNASPGKSVTVSVDPASESYIKIKEFFHQKGLQINISHRTFRIATLSDLENARIHVDNYHYHVIISLTPHHEQQEDYEQIYRYKPHDDSNDIKPIDFLRKQFDDSYLTEVNDIIDHLHCTELFECVLKEPFEFNKAILVNSTYLHFPSNVRFGNTMEEGRLVEIYSVNVISLIPSFLNYRYMWYFENVLCEKTVDLLLDYLKDLFEDSLSRTTTPLTLHISANDLLEFNDGLLEKFIKVYMKYIIENTKDLNYLIKQVYKDTEHTEDKKSIIDTLIPHYSIEAYSYTENASASWDCETCPNSTFIAFLHLNDNETGLSVVDHFTNNTALIPAKKNSLFIIPNSWLYPYRQTKIFKGAKYFLKIYISYSI